MKRAPRIFLLLIWAALVSWRETLPAQDYLFEKVKLPVFEEVTVHDLVQDPEGFLWVATDDGLYRYDGNGKKAYLPYRDDSTTIDGRFVRELLLDSRGYLWFAVEAAGVGRLDRKTGKMRWYRHDPFDAQSLSNNNVFAISEDRRGHLWFGTNGGGLCRLRADQQEAARFDVFRHQPGDPQTISDNWILTLFCDQRGQLWAGTFGGGLNCLSYTDAATDAINIRSLSAESGPLSATRDFWIRGIAETDDQKIWVSSQDNFFYALDNAPGNTGRVVRKTRLQNTPVGWEELLLTRMRKSPSEDIWLAFDIGVATMKDGVCQTVYTHDPSDGFSIGEGAVIAIYFDRMAQPWLGIENNGLYRGERGQPFSFFPTDGSIGLKGYFVRAMAQDRTGSLWIGAEKGGGLFRFHPDHGLQEAFHLAPGGLPSNEITEIYEDTDGRLWLGTHANGFAIYDPATRQFEHFPYRSGREDGPGHQYVQAIRESVDGRFWIGMEGGLDRFDPRTGQWERFRHDPFDSLSISDNRVQSNALLEDPDGVLWVGVWEGGLNRFDPVSQTFRSWRRRRGDPHSLSSNQVIALSRDADGVLWIGTFGGGLNRLLSQDEEADSLSFKRYSRAEGFPYNNVYAIIPDDQGRLWLSTEKAYAASIPCTSAPNFSMKPAAWKRTKCSLAPIAACATAASSSEGWKDFIVSIRTASLSTVRRRRYTSPASKCSIRRSVLSGKSFTWMK